MESYGLLGRKLSHSLSPEIHNKIFELIKNNSSYKLFEIEEDNLEMFIEELRSIKIKGINVTIPYKEKVIKYLDEISEEGKKIGAINTIYLKEDKLIGYNTDYYGFGIMLEYNNIQIKNKRVMVLGNGGATKAIVHYLLDEGVKQVYIISRNSKVDNYKLDKVEIIGYEDIKNIKGDILINSTPVGMYPNMGICPVDKKVINNFEILVDIIYNPEETEFLKIGKTLNKKIIGGLYMLVAQAIKAEEIWNNIKIEKEVIKEIYEEINSKF
ncbi:shikimate dehydrogenase [Clostridium sp.]|uniref:shikimate dehydrogenase n=1 Tax=Clostridium sp. TaxID=1506 RepID=UPI0026128B13|nr:shikimate dehydrogenase [Clostridium sp.]